MRKTQIKVTLKKHNWNLFFFVLFGACGACIMDALKKHANNSLYHFCMPAWFWVLYTDDFIYILLQCCECIIVLSPFYSWGNWGPERLPDSSKVTQLGGTGSWNLRPDSLDWPTLFCLSLFVSEEQHRHSTECLFKLYLILYIYIS